MGNPLDSSTVKHHVLNLLASVLLPDEQTVVLGDLEEAGDGFLTSTGAIVGYFVRREMTAWASMDAWLALLLVVAPCALMLGSVSQSMADGNAIYIWFFANNWDFYLLHQSSFWMGLREQTPEIICSGLALVSWSWCCGVLIGTSSRSTIKGNSLLLCLFFVAIWLGWRAPTVDLRAVHLARDFPGNVAVFRNIFYRDFFLPAIQVILVLLPFFFGSQDRRVRALRTPWVSKLFWSLTGLSVVALLAQASLWWQMRTWTTYPALRPHLPSATPVALAGGLAYMLLRTASRLRTS